MIYFLRNTANRRIKIGFSKNATNRVKSLQNATCDRLELIGVIPGGVKEEKALHRRFEHRWVGREWFLPTAGMISEIADLIDMNSAPKPLPVFGQFNVRIPVDLVAKLRALAKLRRQTIRRVLTQVMAIGMSVDPAEYGIDSPKDSVATAS